MKVTVNFGAVRVIVPCGCGDMPVKQLVELAITRYKKATGKTLDSWVTVHNLKISSDGGILDPDDKLNDVADDREQIIAIFDERESLQFLPHNGGDGTSASSVGTESPDIFQNGDLISTSLNKPLYNGSDVEITTESIPSGLIPLQVRRGSEPALNCFLPVSVANTDPSKRWSAAIIVDESCSKTLNREGDNSEQSEDEPPPGEREEGSGEEKSNLNQYYDKSSKFPVLDSTLEEKAWNNNSSRHCSKDKRKEPLGGPRTSPKLSKNEYDSDASSTSDELYEVVKLKNEEGPLGIHVVPAYDTPGRDSGLVIQGIEPGGRIDRDGCFHIGDRITEINGFRLNKVSFQKAQEIFKDALKAPEINICCVKNNIPHKAKVHSKKMSPPPVYPKPVLPTVRRETDSSDGLTEDEKGYFITKNAVLTPRKSVSGVFGKGSSSTHSSMRKVGRKILIHLIKSSECLGFSISAKDPSICNAPLFIKNILPAGAAIEDGRLKIGDRLLEVNGTEVTGIPQADVVNLLRKIPLGDPVELVVSRQETDSSPSPSLPRELPPEKAGDGVGIFPWKRREVFTFQIPLNDTGSAGLGVSVKGKTSTTPTGAIDMGIFVKSVIHGGAASKDGRLCTNDQLLNINGISLLAMTNSQAMETLRRAMIQGEGPNIIPNAIALTVARRIPSPGPDSANGGVDGAYHDRSDSFLSESGDSLCVSTENLSPNNKFDGVTPDTSTSENSGNTVIFMSQSQRNSVANDSTNSQDRTQCDMRNLKTPLPGKNPVIDRLVGNNEKELERPVLQNDTYAHVSHESWSGDQLQQALNRVEDNSKDNCSLFEKPKQESIKTILHLKSDRSSTPPESTSPSIMKKKDNEYTIKQLISSNNGIILHDQVSVSKDEMNFFRDGFGRQSMPEKRLLQPAIHQNDRYHNGKINESAIKDHSKTVPKEQDMLIDAIKEKPFIPKEMPVDVGPYEMFTHYIIFKKLTPGSTPQYYSTEKKVNNVKYKAHAKLLPEKPNRIKVATTSAAHSSSPVWSNSADSLSSLNYLRSSIQQRSCQSPGCPYHAVPTSGRESGSSRATSVQVGPSLGMCKSSSLESLQTMVHELQKREEGPFLSAASNKNGSARGCNESFRAAVDRSYEAPDSDTMETLQEENENGSSRLQRPPLSHSHFRSATVGATQEKILEKKNAKCKKKGIFKGLGSVFRFGKTNKKAQEPLVATKEDRQQEAERLQARKIAQEEQERIQEHYHKLVEQQRLMQLETLAQQNRHQHPEQEHSPHRPSQISPSCGPPPPANRVPLPAVFFSPQPQSRQERMHLLRAEHQRRHQERRGYYPQEEQEELYEEQIKQIIDGKEMWKRPLPPLPDQKLYSPYHSRGLSQRKELEISHSRTGSFDIYKEMSKPGSRIGFADPNRYSHYMNFQEIQQHLQQFHHQYLPKNSLPGEQISQHQKPRPFSHMQHAILSTSPNHHLRHTLNATRARPISNFFEYESVQTVKKLPKTGSELGTNSLPRRGYSSSRQRAPLPLHMWHTKQKAIPVNGHIPSELKRHHPSSVQYTHADISYGNKVDISGSKV